MHHMFFDLNDLFLFFPLLSNLYSTMMSFWVFASSHEAKTDPRVSRWLINLVFDTWYSLYDTCLRSSPELDFYIDVF